jgi:hypothetical protein
MKRNALENLGEPDITFAGFKVWISGRQFPGTSDYWDGNWLMVTACCESPGARVWAQGPIIHLSEIQHWLTGLKGLAHSILGEAELACIEPELGAKVCLDKLGHGSLVVNITPDHMNEQHQFTFEVDQSFIPGVIRNLEKILDKYPIKGNA